MNGMAYAAVGDYPSQALQFKCGLGDLLASIHRPIPLTGHCLRNRKSPSLPKWKRNIFQNNINLFLLLLLDINMNHMINYINGAIKSMNMSISSAFFVHQVNGAFPKLIGIDWHL
jgi:hypothetical protein